MSLETRAIKLFGRSIPNFAGVSRRCPKSSRKLLFVRGKFPHRGFCTSETRIWARILLNKFWTPEFRTPEFLGRIFWSYFFQEKRPPEKFTVEKFTSQNSPSNIQPRNRAKKFTLHLCRATWLIICVQFWDPTFSRFMTQSRAIPPITRYPQDTRIKCDTPSLASETLECRKWGFKRWGCKQIRGYLRKKAFFLRFLDFPGAVCTLRKRAKKAEKGRKRPISADFQGGRPDAP